MATSFEDQAKQVMQTLSNLTPQQANQHMLDQILTTTAEIPPTFFPQDMADVVARAFGIPSDRLRERFPHPKSSGHMEGFEALVPTHGWLADYIEYTRQTEPPTVFHFFAAATVIGATLQRRIYLPRGAGDIFPNICCVLVAPAGKCKKTTACNLAVNLFRRIGGNVLADKITPEAIIESFKTSQTAAGLLYAPEWAVLIGKQTYLEGLIPMLTALFDCPAVWSSATLMRGATQLTNVALAHLAASNIDFIQTSVPKEALGGGFMSRLLFIVQHDTPRRFALPPPLDATLSKKLLDGLLFLQKVSGAVALSPEAEAWYVDWYDNRTSEQQAEKNLSGYFERKPDRLLQLAMVLNAAADPTNFIISTETLQHAYKILNYIERYLPAAFSELASNTTGDDHQRLLRQIRSAGGTLTNAEWIRMNRSRMNSDMFKKSVMTLKEAGMIVHDPVNYKRYHLLSIGWKQD